MKKIVDLAKKTFTKKRKIVAMIPARLGSQRISKKNIRYLHNKPLVQWIIDAAKDSGVFDEIWLNTEDEGPLAKIAKESGIKFYLRDRSLATDGATNDQFLMDFVKARKLKDEDYIIQLLPTSPFIKPETIAEFRDELLAVDTLISVVENKIECLNSRMEPINFDALDDTLPSQNLKPVYSYACGLMGWNVLSLKEIYEEHCSPYHSYHSRKEVFILDGEETIDVDTEADFQFAEKVAMSLDYNQVKPRYYDEYKSVEYKVNPLLKKDGIEDANIMPSKLSTLRRVNVPQMIRGNSDSFAKTLVNSHCNSATLIRQQSGEGNRKHSHSNWAEWWLIQEGECIFEYWEKGKTQSRVMVLITGDLLFIPADLEHKITAKGGPCTRIAVSRYDVAHFYK